MRSRTEQNQQHRITDEDIVGLKYSDQRGELRQPLHPVECERDRAGHRPLHMDRWLDRCEACSKRVS
jgi:hypothetical protein